MGAYKEIRTKEVERVARTPHDCEVCDRPIVPGYKYAVVTVYCDHGAPLRMRWHVHCLHPELLEDYP